MPPQIQQKVKEFEENLYSIGNKGMVDIPSAIGYFRTSLTQAIQEERERFKGILLKEKRKWKNVMGGDPESVIDDLLKEIID